MLILGPTGLGQDAPAECIHQRGRGGLDRREVWWKQTNDCVHRQAHRPWLPFRQGINGQLTFWRTNKYIVA